MVCSPRSGVVRLARRFNAGYVLAKEFNRRHATVELRRHIYDARGMIGGAGVDALREINAPDALRVVYSHHFG